MSLTRSPRGNPQNREGFWEWFVANEERLRTVTEGHPLLMELADRLHRHHESLQFELSVHENDGNQFIVSAGGIRDLIVPVERLVEAAPSLDGWRIMAFRPRKPCDSIRLEGQIFTPDDFRCSPYPHREHIELDLFANGFDGKDMTPCHAAFLLLDATLGEYDVMTKIGNIDFKPMPNEREGLLRIESLVDLVDSL